MIEQKIDIYSILRKRYPESQYALMQEVSDAAGFNRSRSADFVIMGLWPSRGLSLEGIELKSFRSDWLTELKNPRKAENTFKYCDHFWLLTKGEGVAKLDEIPATWGWMEIKGNKIFTRKEAPKLNPCEITRNYLAALLKRAACKDNYVLKTEIQEQINASRESGIQHVEKKRDRDSLELKGLKDRLQQYKEITGIDLLFEDWRYSTKNIGEAVAYLQKNKPENIVKELLSLETIAKNTLEAITKGIDAIRNVE